MKRYLVIGSGLLGRLLSWRLIESGHTVDILSSDDQRGSDSAAYIAAAMISPATEAISADAKVKEIGLRSLNLWSKWLSELPEQVFFPQNGTLVVAHKGDQSELERFEMRAKHILGKDDFQSLNREQLVQHEAELTDNFDRALYFEQEACIDNRQLLTLLGETLNKHCQWQQCEPIEHLSELALEKLCQHYFQHSREDYDAIIDCRGNGAGQDLKQLRGVRGEVLRVSAPEVQLKHNIRLMHPRYPLYLAPRPNNEYIIGATVIESNDRSPVSVRSGLELLSALYSIHKGFSEARILEMSAHCRPAFTDNMPSIQRTDWGFHINGFYRHGYLFGPAFVDDLLCILAEENENITFKEFCHV